MAEFSPRVLTNFEVPALVTVAVVLVVAAATKGGYPLWAIGAITSLYVLYAVVGWANRSRAALRVSPIERDPL